MPATMSQARDEICSVLKNALSTPYPNFKVLWDDVEGPAPGSVKVGWIRATLVHTGGGTISLGGVNGKKRHARRGTFVAQVFTAIGDGHSTSDLLVNIIMRAYEDGSTPNGVWFRNVQPREVGVSGGWTQVNVLADFEYDEIS